MNIRSITYFLAPRLPFPDHQQEQARRFEAAARQRFQAAGYTVQTTRAATTPFGEWALQSGRRRAPETAAKLEQAFTALGFSYVSIGPARMHQPGEYELLPDVLAATQNLFVAGHMAHPGEVSLAAVRACAGVIHRAAIISADGFANLRFAALASVSAGAPFFPAAYHNGGEPAFALALEAADLAVQAFAGANSLAEAQRGLRDRMEREAAKLVQAAQELAIESGAVFTGLDYSLAPYPEEARSLGAAMERLGIPRLGEHGSLAAAAFLADSIDRARFPRTGFSGLMLPVLEDAVLAQRAWQGSLSIKDLLLYSAVCGTGLDPVPLPGDITVDELAALLLDLAALSTRLGKPLTARLMPLPGKKAGDPTEFDFAYFAPSRVMALQAGPLVGLLASAESFALSPRRER
jgi:hypothetical protein